MTRVQTVLSWTPDSARNLMDSWRFWMMVAMGGLVLALVLGYFNLQRTIHDESTRRTVAYQTCVQSIPELQKISTHVAGVNAFAKIVVRNGNAILAATPTTFPTYHARILAQARIRAAYAQIHAAPDVPVPTIAQCKKLARQQR